MDMSTKPMSLHCKQEVANEWLDKDPTLFNHIAEKIHYEVGKALADKICDGQTYIVKMDKPYQDHLGAVNWECTAIRSDISLDVLVRCNECKIRDNCPLRLIANLEYCSIGEKE